MLANSRFAGCCLSSLRVALGACVVCFGCGLASLLWGLTLVVIVVLFGFRAFSLFDVCLFGLCYCYCIV